jgi:hypothetical protein
MESIKLSVFNLVGSDLCADPDDGKLVFDAICNAINKLKPIEVSFQNIEVLTSSFLNVAIGQLYKDFSEKEIRDFVKIIDINEVDSVLLYRVINTAKLYYQNNKALK